MNAPQVKTSNPPLTLNDALINGLLSGILAGAVMLVFLFLVGLLNGTIVDRDPLALFHTGSTMPPPSPAC
jgi:NADH:ubiquinone oxidoreductase subunit 6 (subunit J)